MAKKGSPLLGEKFHGTRVVPLMFKIVTIFTILLLVSNFTTNYINLMLNRGEQIRLLNQLLVKDLKELHIFANNQREIFQFNQDEAAAIEAIENSAKRNHRGERSVTFGIRVDGTVFFQAGNLERQQEFPDAEALQKVVGSRSSEEAMEEGTVNFGFLGHDYFGVYKYNESWDIFIIRAEELDEFYADSVRIFRNISYIILAITIVFSVIGIILIRFILRYVSQITGNIRRMQEDQQLELVDLTGAPNDDVTYLGVAFNSLASTIDNLMNIFKKFVARDIAAKAYREREIRLEGQRRELTILFTDIKSFTYMTETLGTDIIKLLNLHYDQAIRHIHDLNGDIGSIIGDALLAIFGAMEENDYNKSLQAVQAAYKIQDVAANLRQEMHHRREEILKQRGNITEGEEYVYKAVLLEVGVGIDGGQVFYGNIGSNERMVNTVIGDNVNSSSRLEGLTRFYKVPVICSEYVKDEILQYSGDYTFVELDTVQVKGKTIGKKIFWPVPKEQMDENLRADIDSFQEGLHLYYQGEWPKAEKWLSKSSLSAAATFLGRIKGRTCPKDWNGIWTMKEK